MTAATLLFLPPDESLPWRWWRVEGDAITEGEGVPIAPGEEAAANVIAVAPADAVTLHWAALPARSTAQAVAAARVVVSDATAEPAHDLHVAVGAEHDGDRAIAVVAPSLSHTGFRARTAASRANSRATVETPSPVVAAAN